MANTELIERYLEGSLSPSEQQAFDQRLVQEPAFSEEVALQQQIREGLRATGRARILSQLETVENRMSAYHPPTQVIRFDERIRQRFYWAAAAAILLLIPVYLLLKSNISQEKLFARYFEPYQTAQPLSQDPLDRALQQYRDKNYAKALGILKSMEDQGDVSDSTLFYKANVHLQLDQPREAVASLQKIPASSTFYDEAQWYLALAYLQNNEPERTRERVSLIAQKPGHPYQQRAADLVKDLK